MPYGLTCDAPLGALACPCNVCSGDATLACSSNAECAAALAGTCTGPHGGTPRRPNGCSDNTCEGIGREKGECTGDVNNYCDGAIADTGKAILSCNTNADCKPFIPGSGNCTIAQTRPCFLDPLDSPGSASTEGGVLSDGYCLPATVSGSVNSLFGLPGAARATYETSRTHFCSDAVTEWQIGGANCP